MTEQEMSEMMDAFFELTYKQQVAVLKHVMETGQTLPDWLSSTVAEKVSKLARKGMDVG